MLNLGMRSHGNFYWKCISLWLRKLNVSLILFFSSFHYDLILDFTQIEQLQAQPSHHMKIKPMPVPAHLLNEVVDEMQVETQGGTPMIGIPHGRHAT
jgi:hypothetical protein